MSAAAARSLSFASGRTAAPRVLRVLPAPVVEPPADGQDWDDAPEPASTPRYVQGRLAVDLRHRHDDSFFGPQATSTPDLPEAGPWALRMIRAVLETYEGSRSPDQLSRWVVPEIRERAQRRGLLARRRGRRTGRPPVVRTMLASFPADGVCEVSAVVQADGRVRALAMRMSGVDGRWLITAWELG